MSGTHTAEDLFMLRSAAAFEFGAEGFVVRADRDLPEEGGFGFLRHDGRFPVWAAHYKVDHRPQVWPKVLVESNAPGTVALFWIPWHPDREIPDDFLLWVVESEREAVRTALLIADGLVDVHDFTDQFLRKYPRWASPCAPAESED